MKTKVKSVSVTAETYDLLKKLADTENRSVARQIKHVTEHYAERKVGRSPGRIAKRA
mgnify:CR=1 FL=1|jgi:predicted DNA-binding protein